MTEDLEQPKWRKIVDFPLVAMLVALLIYALGFSAAALTNFILPRVDLQSDLAAHSAISILFLFGGYKLVTRRIGDPPRDDLPAKGALKGLGLGLAMGLVLFSIIVGIAALLDVYNIVGEGSLRSLLVTAIAIGILPAFVEELLFRGILFRFLEDFGGSWFALAITSALFGLAHIFNPNASALSSLAIAVEAGILLGGIYMLTRNLWAAMGLHASWNFTQGYIYDVPVSGIDQEGIVQAQLSGNALLSGGAFGLEASLIAMVVATAAGVWLVLRAVNDGQLIHPWWVRRRLASQEAVRVDVDGDPNLGGPVERA